MLDTARSELDDTYFTLDYLSQIRRRFSIEMFHDKIFEVLNSFQQSRRMEIPSLVNPYPTMAIDPSALSDSIYGPHASYSNQQQQQQQPMLSYAQISANIVEIYHPDHNVTIVHYAPIICENYFNLPAAIFNRSRLGYYRLRLF